MRTQSKYSNNSLSRTREKVESKLSKNGIVILPPMDVIDSSHLIELIGIKAQATIFDPWYNKGVGGERNDYVEYIVRVMNSLAPFSEHIFFWGFPEIISHFVEKIPRTLELRCWLTWFYKNSPSMIRGWRSVQMTCMLLSKPGSKMHVENFLYDVQLQMFKQGKLRFIPGPPSVIEEPLLCGFVGKKEQMGHPAQKPVAVLERPILMGTTRGDLVVDLMSGAGTSAVAAYKNERFSIICDISEEYTLMAEKRLGVRRITLPSELVRNLGNLTDKLRPKKLRMLFNNGKLHTERHAVENRQLMLPI